MSGDPRQLGLFEEGPAAPAPCADAAGWVPGAPAPTARAPAIGAPATGPAPPAAATATTAVLAATAPATAAAARPRRRRFSLDPQIEAQVQAGLAALMATVRTRLRGQRALQHFRADPALRFYRGRLDAGRAWPAEYRIELSADLLETSTAEMLGETLPHEVAHLVVHRIARRASAHGPEWQAVMRDWFGVPPARTHRMDVSAIDARRQRKWAYACGCTRHALSTVRHRRAQAGTRYRCRRCGESLVAVGDSAVDDSVTSAGAE